MIVLTIIFILIGLAAANLPASFYQAMSSMTNEDTLCVKNYDAGASVIESYKNFEHLQKDTQVVSRSYYTSNDEKDRTRGNATLEVHIDSSVIGEAHIAWQSREPEPDLLGRHATYSRTIDDVTGVFNLEKFIRLWSNSTLGTARLDWLPCS